LGVEQEPARADVEDLGSVADDDQRAHLRLEDAVDALAQRRAGRHQPQRGEEDFRATRRQDDLQGLAGCESDGATRSGPLNGTKIAGLSGQAAKSSIASSAARTSGTRHSSNPATSGVEQGTIARVKPTRAASASRRVA